MSTAFLGSICYRLPEAVQAKTILVTSVTEVISVSELPENTAFVIHPFDGGNSNLMAIEGVCGNEPTFIPTALSYPLHPTTGEQYYAAVNESIQRINDGEIRKVIISRIENREGAVDPVKLFDRLCKKYPTAFVYLISLPQTGCWIGATPEILIQEQDKGRYTTVALAGTKLPEEEWTGKELDEQEQVVDYLLKRLALENTAPAAETVNAGPVQHLKTTLEFESNRSVVELAMLLHPTPAVCGTPLQAARNTIRKLEHHDRRLYTGFLGPTGPNEAQLYVNLRCMEIHQNSCTLYLGGGITANSDPEKEWEETERKARTLLSVIEKL